MINGLNLGLQRRLPVILQIEASECGLACLGMVVGFHGHRTDMATLRSRFSVSSKGTTMAELVRIASELDFATRALRVDLKELDRLQVPCILHWNFNHFVVLKSVKSCRVRIHDPAIGDREVSFEEMSRSFTGVALEVWPNLSFKPEERKQTLSMRGLVGRVQGLYQSFAQIILLSLALEVFALVSPLFMQWVIDHVIVTADLDLLTTLVIGFGLLMLFQQLLDLMRQWAILHMGTSLSVQWKANVFTHMLGLPSSFFERRHLGDIVSRFNSVHAIQRTLTTSLLGAILDGLMTLVTLIMMFVYSVTLAWIAIAAILAYALIRALWFRPMRNATEEQIIQGAKQQSHFLETLRGVRTIKLYQRQDDRRSRWLTLLVDEINSGLRTEKLAMAFKFGNGLIFGIQNLVTIWLGASMVLESQLTVGMLMTYMAYRGQFVTRISGLIDAFIEVKMLRLHSERLADIVLSEVEPNIFNPSTANHAVRPASIEVKGLRFRYAPSEPWVLNGVDFKIEACESVCITGPSGGGKTTLMQILLGNLRPTEGEIFINGKLLDGNGMNYLRRICASVQQDDVLFGGSILDNICFFDPYPDRKRASQCAQIAAIHEDIKMMPMVYDTLVGDMGVSLSGGQKQRIFLARALYRQPGVLLLDEATSHLDTERETQINVGIKKLQMTRVQIAHRQETIASADKVILLHRGKACYSH